MLVSLGVGAWSRQACAQAGGAAHPIHFERLALFHGLGLLSLFPHDPTAAAKAVSTAAHPTSHFFYTYTHTYTFCC